MAASIELHGLASSPIKILRSQLHGDKTKFVENPASASIYIRFNTPKKNKQKDTWSVFKGRVYPCPGIASPTLFRDNVFKSIHHAFVACLLWFHGGMSATFQYQFYPREPEESFPLLQITKGVPSIGIPVNDSEEILAVHHLTAEPTHAQLLAFGESLRRSNYRLCMLLVGNVTPKKFNPQTEPPPIRGILLFADLLRPVLNGDDADAFPVGAVQHGWIPCVGGEKMTLQFCMHGQNEVRSIPPISMAPLNDCDQRLWKRHENYFCITQKNAIANPDDWNRRLTSDGANGADADNVAVNEDPQTSPNP